MSVWPQAERDRRMAAARVDYVRIRVVKRALHWSALPSSEARSRDLLLACEQLIEAIAALDALKEADR